jgi:hypothetical protein
MIISNDQTRGGHGIAAQSEFKYAKKPDKIKRSQG